jgi:hypothetical protein
MTMKLSPTQIYWLREIAAPSDNSADFPPLRTLGVLIKLGLVEAYEDPDDLIARLLDILPLRVTDKGRQVLGGLQ